jgi:NADH-quinone oxidoreductase subunit M
LADILDLNGRERAVLIPLVILTVLFGVWPAPILDTSAGAVAGLVEHVRAALGPAASALVELR